MRKQKQLEAMITAIVIMVVGTLLTLFVIKCVQMKKEELERALQGETETDAVEQTAEETTPEETEAETMASSEEETDTVVNGPEEETTAEPSVVETTEAAPEPVIIQGKELDPVVADYLRKKLAEYGIEWWLPYAAAQMFQESGFQILAENRNGLDKGLLQYRITYWSALCTQHGLPAETTIFDWRAQISIYVMDTARRLGSGCSVQDTISRHMMSDYGPYCETYVKDVMRWVR